MNRKNKFNNIPTKSTLIANKTGYSDNNYNDVPSIKGKIC